MTRLADLREILALLMVRVRLMKGVLYPRLASLQPLLDFFHFLNHFCLVSEFLCWITAVGLVSKSCLR